MAVLVCACVLGAFSGATLSSTSISDPDVSSGSGWVPYGISTDVIGDSRAGSLLSTDIVGDSTYPSLYLQYDSSGDEFAVRIRVNGYDGLDPLHPLFRGFAYLGIDADLDGVIDFFIGVVNPMGAGRVAIYSSDPSAPNFGPNTTGLIRPIFAAQPIAGSNYSFVETTDGSNFSDNPDYFITFKFDVADITAAAASLGFAFDGTTPFSFVAGAATQDNTVNGDVNGYDDRIFPPRGSTWMSVGAIGSPISTDGTPWQTVTFDRNSGDIDSAPLMISVTAGSMLGTLPTPPTKRGMTFIGWNSAPDGSGTDITASTVVNTDMTAYAMWTDLLPVTITFNPNGGNWGGSTASITRVTDQGMVGNAAFPPDPVRTSGGTGGAPIFAGWATAQVGAVVDARLVTSYFPAGTGFIGPRTLFYQNTTVYAVWLNANSTNQLKLECYENLPQGSGGEWLYTIFGHNSDCAQGVPNPTTTDAYIFVGWCANPQGTGAIWTGLELQTGGTGNQCRIDRIPGYNATTKTAKVYAIWRPANYATDFRPNNIDINGNPIVGTPTNLPSVTMCVNGHLVVPNTIPTLPGYKFVEWCSDPVYANGFHIESGMKVPASLLANPSTALDINHVLTVSGSNRLLNGVVLDGIVPVYAIWAPVVPDVIVNVTFDATEGKIYDIDPFSSEPYDPDGKRYMTVTATNGQLDYIPTALKTDQNGEFIGDFLGWSYYPPGHPNHRVDCNPYFDEFWENTTLYAVWEKIYTVTFWTNNGYWWDSTNDPIRVGTLYGRVAYIPTSPTRPGWTFNGWNTRSDGQGDTFFLDTPVNSNMNVYAQWIPDDPNAVEIIYDLNDGTGRIVDGEFINNRGVIIDPNNIPPNPDNGDGWRFGGWYKDEECTVPWDFEHDLVDPDGYVLVLYAKWEVRVDFDLNDDGSGIPIPSVWLPLGSTVNEPTPPIWGMRDFRNWFKESDAHTVWDFLTDTVHGPTVIYAGWRLMRYEPFSFVKVDAEDVNTVLPGAKFALFESNIVQELDPLHVHDQLWSLGSNCWIEIAQQVSDQYGVVDFGTLSQGTYRLVELKAPSGFRLPLGQWEIIVNTSDVEPPIEIKGIGSAAPPAFFTSLDGTRTVYYLPNMRPLNLPFTGGSGRLILTIVGFVCMTAAVVLSVLYLTGRIKLVSPVGGVRRLPIVGYIEEKVIQVEDEREEEK